MRTLIQSSHREVARAMLRAERATRTTTRSYATAATQARSSSSQAAKQQHLSTQPSHSLTLSSPLLPTHAQVFVVGPGNYLEYQSLRQRAQAAVTQPGLTGRKITYGCAEVATPTEFVAMLAGLGGSA